MTIIMDKTVFRKRCFIRGELSKDETSETEIYIYFLKVKRIHVQYNISRMVMWRIFGSRRKY